MKVEGSLGREIKCAALEKIVDESEDDGTTFRYVEVRDEIQENMGPGMTGVGRGCRRPAGGWLPLVMGTDRTHSHKLLDILSHRRPPDVLLVMNNMQ